MKTHIDQSVLAIEALELLSLVQLDSHELSDGGHYQLALLRDLHGGLQVLLALVDLALFLLDFGLDELVLLAHVLLVCVDVLSGRLVGLSKRG